MATNMNPTDVFQKAKKFNIFTKGEGARSHSLPNFSEKRCPKCDFLTQRDGWMFGKHNFNDVHPRGGLTKVDEDCAKCPVRCGFKMNPNDFDD